MCCCIPLRRLSYFGAILHLWLGTLYLYFLGCVAYSLYSMKEKPNHEERMRIGLLYMGYYTAFIFPGVFILWGVHKQLRCFLVFPSILFFCIQAYGVTLEGIYKYRPHYVPQVMERYNDDLQRAKLKLDYWMDMAIQITVTLGYLFMLFFYYREIEPEDTTPIQSRYAQAYLQQHMQQQTAASSSSSPPVMPLPPPPPPHHSHHHNQYPPLPPVPSSFRPGASSSSQPHSLMASNSNLRMMNPPNPPSSSGPFGALQLTYEQQQQLLKLQQHPLILQQFQQQQQLQEDSDDGGMPHQHHHHHHQFHHLSSSSSHSHHQHHHLLQQQGHPSSSDQLSSHHPHLLFQQASYAQMLGGDPSSNNKTPKF